MARDITDLDKCIFADIRHICDKHPNFAEPHLHTPYHAHNPIPTKFTLFFPEDPENKVGPILRKKQTKNKLRLCRKKKRRN